MHLVYTADYLLGCIRKKQSRRRAVAFRRLGENAIDLLSGVCIPAAREKHASQDTGSPLWQHFGIKSADGKLIDR